jgi:hypothetical protein
VIQFFYSGGSRTIKAFKEAVPSDLLPHIKQILAFKDNRPTKGDLILVAGEAAASKEVERFAWRLGGYPIYVPECGEWLEHRIRDAIANGKDLVMVDSALASTNQYSGAK